MCADQLLLASLQAWKIRPAPKKPAPTRQTEAKKVDKAEAEDNGLTFGARRGVLAWQIESLCYSYLPLDALSRVFWCSRSLSARVVRFLQETRALQCAVLCPDDAFARDLAVHHCKSLQHLTAVNGSAREFTEQHTQQAHRCLAKLIANNKRTLRVVRDSTLCSVLGFDLTLALTDCPMLEHICLSNSELADTARSRPLVNKITLARLPHLQSVQLSSSPRFVAPLAISDAIASILKQGFALRDLWLGDAPVSSDCVRLLASPSCAGLDTLSVCPFPAQSLWKTGEEAVAALYPCFAECGKTFEALPALTNLHLHIPGCNTQLHKLKWALPALRVLEIRDKATFRNPFASCIDSCPFFECPQLEYFMAEAVAPGPAVLEHMFSMLEPCKRLKRIYIEQQDSADPFEKVECDRLVSALQSGAWPELASMRLKAKRLTSPVVKALAQHSRPLLVLHIEAGSMRAGAELQALLRQNKSLESLSIECDASFPLHPPEVLPSDDVVLPALTDLKLNFAKEECFQRLSFPNLTRLSLSHGLWLRDLAALLTKTPALSSFLLHCDALADAWITRKRFAHVRELDLQCDAKRVPEFLSAFPWLSKLHFNHTSWANAVPLTWLHQLVVLAERGGLSQLEHFSLSSIQFRPLAEHQSELHIAKQLIAALPKLTKMESHLESQHGKALNAWCKTLRRPLLWPNLRA